MASVGFRRPQFSEDLAWLPPWLQQHHAEPSGQCTKDTQTHFEQPFRDFGFVRNITEENEADLLSRREGRYNSCHLFLTGEDNSPISFAQSPANVLQFHLHLSSDLDTPCGQSQILNASKAQFDSSKVLSAQQVENSGCPEEKTVQSKMNCKASGVKATGTTEMNISSQSFHNEREKGRKHERKSDVKGLKSADINYAVEFSIAASEALVIHELVKDETTLKCLRTSAILEAALRVKQARLDKLEEAFHCPTDEIDKFDLLSDLDDLTMADAFEDVGLSFNFQDEQYVCGLDVSQVKETPLSGNHETYGCQVTNGEFADPKLGFDNLSRKYSEDVQAIDMQLVSIEKVHDDLALGLNPSGAAGYVDPMLHQLAFENSNHVSTSQRIDSSMVNVPSSQPLADNSSSLAWNSDNPEVDKGSSFTSDRFKSRWLGGWSTKEVDTSAQLQQNGAKGIPKFFLRESSFLSESADVAPDENSCVEKHKSSSNVASQSSILFKGLCDKANEGILLSQDGSGSCSLSFVDPLCSVVPCSISSDNAESHVAKNQNDVEVGADKCGIPSSKLGMDNLQKTSDLNGECLCVDKQTTPPNKSDCCEARIQRRLSSLKTYSTYLPNHQAQNLLFTSECDQALLHLDQNAGSTRHSYEINHKDFEPLRHISDYRVGIDNEQNNETTVIAGATTLERNNEQEPDEAEVQDQPLKERGLPVILNRRTRRHLQAYKTSVDDSTKEESPDHAVVPESLIELQNSKNFPEIPSEHSNTHGTQVPPRKRVHFLEAGVELKNGPQKLQSSHKSWLTTGADKRLKYSNPELELESQAQDAKRHFTTRWVKHRKTLIFQGIQFLLTGLPGKKGKEIEGLIHKYGGVVLSDIPSLNSRGKRHSRSNFMQLPVVLCSKKLQTTKFLYGCAVNTFILKVNWLTDSIAAGSVVPPEKYMILPSQTDVRHSRISKLVCRDYHKCIFERVGIMLQGKQSFCTKLAKIIKHGDGMVFKTLQSLIQSLDSGKISVGAIVAENEGRASRHLRQCASERKIPMMPSSWIVKSLHSGKMLPLPRKKHSSPLSTILVSEFLGSMSDEL